MKEKKSAGFLLEVGIGGYLLAILFNGYLMHLGLTAHLIETIRPFLPECFILFILFAWILSRPRIMLIDLQLWLYLLFVCALGLTRIPSAHSILSVVRDYLEPLILLTVVSSFKITELEKEKLFRLIGKVFALFIVIGFFFSVRQKLMGWQWTSEYFAGYAVWGVDKNASIRVSNGWMGFKVLGTTGSAETFGFYSAYAILFLLYNGFRRKPLNYILVIMAGINLFLSGMKTPMLIILMILFATLVLPRRKKMGVFGMVLMVIFGAGIFLYMIMDAGAWTETSVYLRLILWQDLLDLRHMINLLIPRNIFQYSDGAGNVGITGFWDNSYLYIMFSTGVLGLVLLLQCIVRRYKIITRVEKNKFTQYTMLYLALSSLTTCIFFGRNVITTLFLVLGLSTAAAKGETS